MALKALRRQVKGNGLILQCRSGGPLAESTILIQGLHDDLSPCSTRTRSKLCVRRISTYPSLSPMHNLWSAWSLYPWQVPQMHSRFSCRSGLLAFNRRIKRAGARWSTWRFTPTCLKSTPQDGTSMPIATPTAVSAIACSTMSDTMSNAVAPSAMRIPISRVRAVGPSRHTRGRPIGRVRARRRRRRATPARVDARKSPGPRRRRFSRNSKRSRSPQRRPKKGALRGPGKRNRPGNRNALRSSGAGRTGFRSCRDGRTAAGVAFGRSGRGTTAQRRHQRLCETGITLSLRRCGPLSRPSREDLRKRVGTFAFGAGLLRL